MFKNGNPSAGKQGAQIMNIEQSCHVKIRLFPDSIAIRGEKEAIDAAVTAIDKIIAVFLAYFFICLFLQDVNAMEQRVVEFQKQKEEQVRKEQERKALQDTEAALPVPLELHLVPTSIILINLTYKRR